MREDAGGVGLSQPGRVADWSLKWLLPDVEMDSPHNRNLRRYALTWLAVGGLAVVVGMVLLLFSWPGEKSVPDLLSSVIVGMAGLALSKIQSAGEAANRRKGIADIFFSDIVSICWVMHSLRLPDPYVWRHAHSTDPASALPMPGVENYVNIFDEKCADLTLLDPQVVYHVTAFYRYFLSARDSARRLAPWESMSEAERKGVLVAVMIQLWFCFTQAEAAIVALDRGRAPDHCRILDSMIRRCRDFLSANLEARQLDELGLGDGGA